MNTIEIEDLRKALQMTLSNNNQDINQAEQYFQTVKDSPTFLDSLFFIVVDEKMTNVKVAAASIVSRELKNMVQKNKFRRNNKADRNNNRNRENNKSSKDDSIQSLFKELNDPLYGKGYLKSDCVYEFYIVSRSWMRMFRRARRDESLADMDVINADLLINNIYGFENQKIDHSCKYILKNNLILDEDYEAVTDEAWNLLTTIVEYITVKKSFYVDKDYDLIDMDEPFSINTIFIDEKKDMQKQMLSMNRPRTLNDFYSTLFGHFKIDNNDFRLFLFDSRKTIKEFEAACKNNTLLGKLVETSKAFPFHRLKDHDILIICANPEEYTASHNLDENEGAYCYNCRDCTNLYYHCSCNIVSYCSMDCKYSDFLLHRAFCNDISNYAKDIHMDVKNFEQFDLNEGLVGLKNIGNSCYLNCLLQIIKFNDIVKTHLSTRDSKFVLDQPPYAGAIYHLFYALWHSKKRSIKPWFLKIAIGLKHNDYLYFDQNDAHECFINTIDDINDVNDPIYKEIAQTYRGQMVSKIKCINCPKEIVKNENFYSLSLPLIEEKLKTKITINKAVSSDYLTLNSHDTVIENDTKLSNLIESDNNGIFYLADKEKIACIVDGKNETLERILDEAKEQKNNECLLISQQLNKTTNYCYLGLSFTETKPTTTKFFDIKLKICRMRVIPAEIEGSDEFRQIKAQDIRINVLKYILAIQNIDRDFSRELEYLNSDNKLLRIKVCAKLLNCEELIPVIQKPDYPRKNHYKIEAQELTTDNKHDAFEYDKSAYEADINKYEHNFKEFLQHEKDIALTEEILKNIEPLSPEYQFELFYANKAEICQNCGKKMKHNCKLKVDQKLLIPSSNLIEVNIEFPKSSVLAQNIKSITSFENDIKPLSLAKRKADLTLRSCLDGFFSPEKIDFTCEKCNNTNSTIQTEIDIFPETLIIQFKRFATMFNNNQIKQVKNEQFIDYDFTLELEKNIYDLCGVVNHKGEINNGHYTACAYNSISKSWILYDDDDVATINNPSFIKSKENYLLFFKRRHSLN